MVKIVGSFSEHLFTAGRVGFKFLFKVPLGNYWHKITAILILPSASISVIISIKTFKALYSPAIHHKFNEKQINIGLKS